MINRDSFFLKCHTQEEGVLQQLSKQSRQRQQTLRTEKSQKTKVGTIPQTFSDERCHNRRRTARTAHREKDVATSSTGVNSMPQITISDCLPIKRFWEKLPSSEYVGILKTLVSHKPEIVHKPSGPHLCDIWGKRPFSFFLFVFYKPSQVLVMCHLAMKLGPHGFKWECEIKPWTVINIDNSLNASFKCRAESCVQQWGQAMIVINGGEVRPVFTLWITAARTARLRKYTWTVNLID